MTTTTGDPSTLKSPASLSSGDLVSRLLAATPPYLYNVPLTPHSFFFSEMLRSFVQAKTEPPNLASVPSAGARRRKRSWKDATPLELTTDKRSRHHHHHHHHSQQHHQDKYFQSLQQHVPENLTDSKSKSRENYELETKTMKFEQNLQSIDSEVPKSVDDNCTTEFKQKNYFADRLPQNDQPEVSMELQKVKPEEQDKKNLYNERSSELSFGGKNKLDFSARNFLPNLPRAGRSETELQAVKNYGLPGNVQSSADFLPGPLWYPPYPMPQSYPGIDPLHFFIDLRVSGHIWDQKLGSDKQLPFKGKHSSAFSVPQSKECNRPLNLTRNEVSSTAKSEINSRGTHYILKHIRRTYKDIHEVKQSSKTEADEEEPKSAEDDSSIKKEDVSSASSQDEDKKDIRAIIGLELVVDYVKEPKCDPTQEQSSSIAE